MSEEFKIPSFFEKKPKPVLHLHVSLSVLGAESYAMARELLLDHESPSTLRDAKSVAAEYRRVAELLEQHIEGYASAAVARLTRVDDAKLKAKARRQA